jgi:hypothetical protein
MDSDWNYQLHRKGMVVAHKDKGDVLNRMTADPSTPAPSQRLNDTFANGAGNDHLMESTLAHRQQTQWMME